MPRITATDGTELYVKDWGDGRPVVLIHGWPLNADSWEHQAVTLAAHGHRVVSYDRRGFGRSDQPYGGYDYDTFADDLNAVIEGLGLTSVALVGFSMGGGEVARYLSRHGASKVSAAVLISSVVPYLIKADDNPDGVPENVIAGIIAGLRKDRPAFLRGFFNTFYGQGVVAGVSDEVLQWSMHMAFHASPVATLACVDAFAHTDFRGDMAAFTMPTLIVHGTADKTVPIDPTARQAARMIPGARVIEYEGGAHGLTATHAEELSEALLQFLRE
jgi:non-heme chloroperoxidase